MTISDTMWKAISILGQKQRQGSRNPEDDFLLMGKGSGKRGGGREGDERIARGNPTRWNLKVWEGFSRAGVTPSRMNGV